MESEEYEIYAEEKELRLINGQVQGLVGHFFCCISGTVDAML
jgi:hypothetical protein